MADFGTEKTQPFTNLTFMGAHADRHVTTSFEKECHLKKMRA